MIPLEKSRVSARLERREARLTGLPGFLHRTGPYCLSESFVVSTSYETRRLKLSQASLRLKSWPKQLRRQQRIGDFSISTRPLSLKRASWIPSLPRQSVSILFAYFSSGASQGSFGSTGRRYASTCYSPALTSYGNP